MACRVCGGSGVVPYYKFIRGDKYQYFAHCVCDAGWEYTNCMIPASKIAEIETWEGEQVEM